MMLYHKDGLTNWIIRSKFICKSSKKLHFYIYKSNLVWYNIYKWLCRPISKKRRKSSEYNRQRNNVIAC